ncbi:MAG: class II fructose-bisphosphate aldolase [Lentisphaerae bacterium]|jgi:ketose-bisphosphate aldolase|nr:class II fructose-bisphosphate aldolase [Lentisphaerota bacterium]MBT4820325.1 class II fructose-bisphosphate aldolase [Lentisphaerota bacterium]MBT5610890.1 class II fructose-bisphosphate aldolase [Lentisphaerota bacterium]MBT7059516.1 class II fructose-bisphosphate aldolase [Lentisphaerota bacterium]MBT7846718.1 class II fructose-bisphosphate aldolase [Lentisphaerota bacterium]
MKFASAGELVNEARAGGYAVPALNTNGGAYDITRAALEAAQAMQAPLILQVYEPNTAYRGFGTFVKTAGWLCDELDISVPVALQLDHGKSFESVVRAMGAGLTAVMIDASHDPLAENIAVTNRVIDVARSLGVTVEAEVGYVSGNEPKPDVQIGRVSVPERPPTAPGTTSVEEATAFVAQTRVDMLAVAIGTTHGVYQHQDDLNFELLGRIRDAVDVPLVMHGTSGISTENLSRLAQNGMAKINFGEPFRYNYIRYFNELTDGMEHLWHSWKIMQEVKNRLAADMEVLIKALGADGKAGC